VVVDEEHTDAGRGFVQGRVSGKLGDRRVGREDGWAHRESTA